MKDRLITVAAFQSPAEAALAQQRLEAEGMPAFVADQAMAVHFSMAIGGAKLQVPQSHAARAREILRQLPSAAELAEEDEDADDSCEQ